MSISFEKALGIREHSMRLRVERAEVLSSNLANVDTPNFKAKDIDFQTELATRLSPPVSKRLRSTHAGHIGQSSMGPSISEQLYRTPSQPAIDGNTVEEHVEHAEFMQNSQEFQIAFTLLNGSFKGLKKAIRGE